MHKSGPHLPRVEWTATLDTLNIRETRSRGQDTLFASISIKVGDNAAVSSPVISLGNHNNGQFNVPGCTTPVVFIPSFDTPVKVGITVVNWGNNPNAEMVGDIAEAIVSTGADDVIPGSGEIVDAMYAVLGPLAFANCDGPVVLFLPSRNRSKTEPRNGMSQRRQEWRNREIRRFASMASRRTGFRT
jgi:hypothetical protein